MFILRSESCQTFRVFVHVPSMEDLESHLFCFLACTCVIIRATRPSRFRSTATPSTMLHFVCSCALNPIDFELISRG